MHIYYEIAEKQEPIGRLKKSRYYTLRELANLFQIPKQERSTYYRLLRREGIISHNNQPTNLARTAHLFKEFNNYEVDKKKPAYVTYVGAIVISDILAASYIFYPIEYEFDIERPYLKETTRQRIDKKWPPGQGW